MPSSLTALVLELGVNGEAALLLGRIVTGVGHDGRLAAIAAVLDCIKDEPEIDSINPVVPYNAT